MGGGGGGEAGRLLPSGSEVKNGWHSATTHPVYCDGEYRDNFTFCYHL